MLKRHVLVHTDDRFLYNVCVRREGRLAKEVGRNGFIALALRRLTVETTPREVCNHKFSQYAIWPLRQRLQCPQYAAASTT